MKYFKYSEFKSTEPGMYIKVLRMKDAFGTNVLVHKLDRLNADGTWDDSFEPIVAVSEKLEQYGENK